MGVKAMLYESKIRYIEIWDPNGEKLGGKATGFVKLDCWGESCSILVQLSGLPRKEDGEHEIFLSGQSEKFEGVILASDDKGQERDGTSGKTVGQTVDLVGRDAIECSEKKQRLLGHMTVSQGKGRFELLGLESGNVAGTGLQYIGVEELEIPLSRGRKAVCVLQEDVCRNASKKNVNGLKREKYIQTGEGKPQIGNMEAKIDERKPQTSNMEAKADERKTQDGSMEAREHQGVSEVGQTVDLNPQSGKKVMQETEPKLRDGSIETQTVGENLQGSDEELQAAGSDIEAESVETQSSDQTSQSAWQPKSSRMPPIGMKAGKWEQLDSIYPHIAPFGDGRRYLQISPGDFVILKDKSYRRVNNSFLLHGFFTYRHLILHQVRKKGEPVYYVGVPGHFYDKEKEVALLFGFESFEGGMEPAKEGDFGYYMMRVEL